MKKELGIGILVGLIANTIGLLIVAFLIGKAKNHSLTSVIETSISEDSIGQLMSLGAILNLIAFFIFIKKRQDYRARGVLLITVCIAVCTFLLKLF